MPEETDETEQTPTPREVAEDKAVSEKAKSVSDDGSEWVSSSVIIVSVA